MCTLNTPHRCRYLCHLRCPHPPCPDLIALATATAAVVAVLLMLLILLLQETLCTALAMGADRAIHVQVDPKHELGLHLRLIQFVLFLLLLVSLLQETLRTVCNGSRHA